MTHHQDLEGPSLIVHVTGLVRIAAQASPQTRRLTRATGNAQELRSKSLLIARCFLLLCLLVGDRLRPRVQPTTTTGERQTHAQPKTAQERSKELVPNRCGYTRRRRHWRADGCCEFAFAPGVSRWKALDSRTAWTH